jgi:hypothetical protein
LCPLADYSLTAKLLALINELTNKKINKTMKKQRYQSLHRRSHGLKLIVLVTAFAAASIAMLRACEQCAQYAGNNFTITKTSAAYEKRTDSIVMEIRVKGKAGDTTPKLVGKLDGAPVLGYVFPTTLTSEDVGFSPTTGIVALALTSHPDFDDSPIWDENGDGIYDNDGLVWHPHWVVLVKDERVTGGLAVKEFPKDSPKPKLPPTAPPMPMFMDSPSFTVKTSGDSIRVAIPAARIKGRTDFKFDAVACYMQVNTSDMMMPMLGVMKVYSVASGNLSLPYTISK